MPDAGKIHGLVGQFAEPGPVAALAHELRDRGFRRFDVYSPLPLPELDDVLPRRPVVLLTLIMAGAAFAGAMLGYLMQHEIAAVLYPINIGGRPVESWPAFVPTAWETCALFVVYGGFAALLVFCRLPRLYHPIFAAASFERASQDRIFLCVEARDPRFDAVELTRLFAAHRALGIAEVAP